MVVRKQAMLRMDASAGAPKLDESYLTFSYVKTTNLFTLFDFLVSLKLWKDFVLIHLRALGFTWVDQLPGCQWIALKL